MEKIFLWNFSLIINELIFGFFWQLDLIFEFVADYQYP